MKPHQKKTHTSLSYSTSRLINYLIVAGKIFKKNKAPKRMGQSIQWRLSLIG
jgi:hypothetical protein